MLIWRWWVTTLVKSTITIFKGLLTLGGGDLCPYLGPFYEDFFLALTRWLSYQRLFFMRKICRQEWSSIFLSLCEELASEKRKHIAPNIRPQRPNWTNPSTLSAAQDVYRNFIDSTVEAGHCSKIIMKNADQYALIEKGQLFLPLWCEHCFTHDSHMTCTFCPGSKGLQMLTENRDNLLSGHNTL